MGDRANVIVVDGGEQVCLYTHWAGSELPQTLQEALIRGRERWDDAQYLARIIFCEMVRGCEMRLTGYGISQTPGDGQDRILYVDIASQSVSINRGAAMPFDAYVTMAVEWPG